MKKKIIKRTIIILYLVFIIFSSLYTVFPWFFSTDARNMRKNLTTFSSDMSKISGIEKINAKNPFKYSYPYAARTLCDLSEGWNSGFLSGIIKKEEKIGSYDLDSPVNPYNSYKKLMLSANDNNLQVIYDTMIAQEAIVNPNNVMSNEMLMAWNEEYSTLKMSSISALDNMGEIMQGGIITELIIIMPLWIYFVIKIIIGGRRYVIQTFNKERKRHRNEKENND